MPPRTLATKVLAADIIQRRNALHAASQDWDYAFDPYSQQSAGLIPYGHPPPMAPGRRGRRPLAQTVPTLSLVPTGPEEEDASGDPAEGAKMLESIETVSSKVEAIQGSLNEMNKSMEGLCGDLPKVLEGSVHKFMDGLSDTLAAILVRLDAPKVNPAPETVVLVHTGTAAIEPKPPSPQPLCRGCDKRVKRSKRSKRRKCKLKASTAGSEDHQVSSISALHDCGQTVPSISQEALPEDQHTEVDIETKPSVETESASSMSFSFSEPPFNSIESYALQTETGQLAGLKDRRMIVPADASLLPTEAFLDYPSVATGVYSAEFLSSER